MYTCKNNLVTDLKFSLWRIVENLVGPLQGQLTHILFFPHFFIQTFLWIYLNQYSTRVVRNSGFGSLNPSQAAIPPQKWIASQNRYFRCFRWFWAKKNPLVQKELWYLENKIKIIWENVQNLPRRVRKRPKIAPQGKWNVQKLPCRARNVQKLPQRVRVSS